MRVEFKGLSYNIGNKTKSEVCSGCVIIEYVHLKCLRNSEGCCTLPFNKIYIHHSSYQIFKL